MATTVINVRTKSRTGVTMIDRSTVFGNPFPINFRCSREQSITKYKVWFYEMINHDQFREAVELLKNRVLGCWCKPLACHGDIIVEYLDGTKHETAYSRGF